MSVQKRWWLYVLLLEKGKYYVGITSKTPEARFKQHLNGFAGASWTHTHKPIKIIYSEDLGYTTIDRAKAYENKVTRKYIKAKGINNVRGGDLRDNEEYVNILGFVMLKEWWKAILMISSLAIVILFLTLTIILS